MSDWIVLGIRFNIITANGTQNYCNSMVMSIHADILSLEL